MHGKQGKLKSDILEIEVSSNKIKVRKDLTLKNGLSELASFSFPIIATAIIQITQSITTLAFIGRLDSPNYLGAVTLGNMVCNDYYMLRLKTFVLLLPVYVLKCKCKLQTQTSEISEWSGERFLARASQNGTPLA